MFSKFLERYNNKITEWRGFTSVEDHIQNIKTGFVEYAQEHGENMKTVQKVKEVKKKIKAGNEERNVCTEK